jgi:hypothetical protein
MTGLMLVLLLLAAPALAADLELGATLSLTGGTDDYGKGALMGFTVALEGRQLFADQSVEDNLLLGAYTRLRDRRRVTELMERELDRFPILRQRRHQLAGTRSGLPITPTCSRTAAAPVAR